LKNNKKERGAFHMRTIWKGAISFGLVSIPIKLFPATEQKDIKFRFLHKTCQAPLKYQRVCSACGQEVTQEDIVRGYEYESGRFVIMNEEDLEKIPDERTRTIDIVDFVALKEIDPVYFDKTYYLSPNDAGEKAYALLRKAMEETGKIAVAKVVIRNKESLAVIRGYQNLLVMETVFYPDEIRNPELLPGFEREVKLHDNELKMARELIENLATEFVPDKYDDEYRKKLLELIRSKIEGEEIAIPEVETKGKVVDLMEALKASVEMAKKTGEVEVKQTRKRRKKAAGE
jgi:DNA end-binding protein Ku